MAFLSEDPGCAQWPQPRPVWWLWVGAVCWVTRPASFPLPPPQSLGPEELPCPSEGSRENLLRQAMQNSGIVLERVTGEEGALEPAPPTSSSPRPLGDGPPELPLLEVDTVGACTTSLFLLGVQA